MKVNRVIKKIGALALMGIVLAAGGCKSESPAGSSQGQKTEDGYKQLTGEIAEGEEIAVMTTNFGVVKLRFFPEYAPMAVENFITHSKNGYYNGLTFHRVIQTFMIQGGDPSGDGTGGESIFDSDFGLEVTPQLHHIRGALSMANSGSPNSNGSQFFIVQNNNLDNYVAGSLRGGAQDLKDNPDRVLTQDENGKDVKVKELFPDEFLDSYLNNGGVFPLDYGYTVFGQVFEGMDVVDAIAAVEVNGDDKPLEDVIIETITIEKYAKQN